MHIFTPGWNIFRRRTTLALGNFQLGSHDITQVVLHVRPSWKSQNFTPGWNFTPGLDPSWNSQPGVKSPTSETKGAFTWTISHRFEILRFESLWVPTSLSIEFYTLSVFCLHGFLARVGVSVASIWNLTAMWEIDLKSLASWNSHHLFIELLLIFCYNREVWKSTSRWLLKNMRIHWLWHRRDLHVNRKKTLKRREFQIVVRFQIDARWSM